MKQKKLKKTKKPFSYYAGSLLMVLAISAVIYIYAPIIKLHFFPPQRYIEIPKNQYVLSIPSIKATSPIVPNVDPWNETVYKAELKKGVAHAKGTALPGQKGGTYLFAHSSDYPWNITRYNTAFFNLNKVKVGDTIFIYYGKDVFNYSVKDIKEVWPTEVEHLSTRNADLIMQTCTPTGTDLKRLLVFATLTSQTAQHSEVNVK